MESKHEFVKIDSCVKMANTLSNGDNLHKIWNPVFSEKKKKKKKKNHQFVVCWISLERAFVCVYVL